MNLLVFLISSNNLPINGKTIRTSFFLAVLKTYFYSFYTVIKDVRLIFDKFRIFSIIYYQKRANSESRKD